MKQKKIEIWQFIIKVDPKTRGYNFKVKRNFRGKVNLAKAIGLLEIFKKNILDNSLMFKDKK